MTLRTVVPESQEVVTLSAEISSILFDDRRVVPCAGAPGLPDVEWSTVLDLAAKGIEAAAALDAFPGFGILCKGVAAVIRFQSDNMKGDKKQSEVDKLIGELDRQVSRLVNGLDAIATELQRQNLIKVQDDVTDLYTKFRAFLVLPNPRTRKEFLDVRNRLDPEAVIDKMRTRVVDHDLLATVMASAMQSHRAFDAWNGLVQNACGQLILCQLLYLEIGEIKDEINKEEKINMVKKVIGSVKAIYDNVDKSKENVKKDYLRESKAVGEKADEICKKFSDQSNQKVSKEIAEMLHKEYYWFEHDVILCSPFDQNHVPFGKDYRRRHAIQFREKYYHNTCHGSEFYIVQLSDTKKSDELEAQFKKENLENDFEKFIDGMKASSDALDNQFSRGDVCDQLCKGLLTHIKEKLKLNGVIVVSHTYYNAAIAMWDTDLYDVRNSRKPFYVKWTPNTAHARTGGEYKSAEMKYFNNRSRAGFIPGDFIGYCVQVILLF